MVSNLVGQGATSLWLGCSREPPLLWEERERVERKQTLSSCQHVEHAPPGAMACECPPCYHLPPGERGHLWALLTLQFLGGSWICAARHPYKAGLPKFYVSVWSLQAIDAPESVTPQGILSIMRNSQHVAQECRHWHGSVT